MLPAPDRVHGPWIAWLRRLSLTFALASPVSAWAAPPPAEPPAQSNAETLPPIEPHNTCNKQPLHARFHITLDREARLVDLVRWMSSVTCQKFIWSPGVRDGKVTVIAPEPVSIQQAYAAFYAALETMGLTVEESGPYLKIVESKDVSRHVLPVVGVDGEVAEHDRFVTRLYRPQPGRIDDVITVIEHLRGARGAVLAVGDLVVVTDTGSNLARMMEVIEEVDVADLQAEPDAIFLHPLRHADPEEIARVVQEVFMDATAETPAAAGARPPRARAGTESPTRAGGEARPRATPPPTPSSSAATEARVTAISIDARTRTLIITAPRADYPVVRRLIDSLDIEADDDASTLFVLPLQHADPEEVAQVLGSLPTGEGQGPASSAGTRSPAASPGPAGARAGVSIGGSIHVTADPSTRSLVVMASHRDYLALRRVVEALDIERRQVYIETYILELSTRHELKAGASGHWGRDVGDGGLGFVSSAPGGSSSALLDASVLSGLAAGVLGPSIPGSANLLGTDADIPAFGVVIQALEQHDDVNIVADPHLYTADNKTARMVVGQKLPVPNGSTSFASATQNQLTQTTYSREDVSLELEVTPHLGEGDSLTLDISIHNEEIADKDNPGGPITTNRELELEAVIARDGQPVVLGGLVQEKEIVSKRQVPGLGSIPLVGWLFKSRVRTREKVNLLVVLVPHVLDSPDDARRVHERRILERREFLERESAFARRDLETHINYRHKSGLLSAVEAEGRRMDTELGFARQAQAELDRSAAHRIAPEGSVELTTTRAAPEAGPGAPAIPIAGGVGGP